MKRIVQLVVAVLLAAFQGLSQQSVTLTAPPPPYAQFINATVVGPVGTFNYYYWVNTRYPVGSVMNPISVHVRNGPATISPASSIQVGWTLKGGATGYDLIRTTTANFTGTCTGCVVSLNQPGAGFLDTGGPTTNWPPPGLVAAGNAKGFIQINNRDGATPYLFASPPFGGGGGGAPAGSPGAVQFYGTGGVFAGDATKFYFNPTALSTPAAPTVVIHGTGGLTSYAYIVEAVNLIGATLPSTPTTISGNAVLDGTNWNEITPISVVGAVEFNVYVSTSGGNYEFIGTIPPSTTLLDKGLPRLDRTPATVNRTTGQFISDNLRVGGHASFGVGAFAGGSLALTTVINDPVLTVIESPTSVIPHLSIWSSVFELQPNPASDASNSTYTSLLAGVAVPPGNSQPIGHIGAIYTPAYHFGTGAIGELVGIVADVETIGASAVNIAWVVAPQLIVGDPGGSINTAEIWGGSYLANAGTITTLNQIHLPDVANTGTVTMNRGILIDNLTAGATNIAIQTGLGAVDLGDNLLPARASLVNTPASAPNSTIRFCTDCDPTAVPACSTAAVNPGTFVHYLNGTRTCAL